MSGDDGGLRLGGGVGGGPRLKLRGHEEGGSRAELNTTSMTDVIFILLIFFVSLSQLRTSAEQIEWPSVDDEPTAIEDEREPSIIEITRDGRVLLDGRRVEVSTLVGVLGRLRHQLGHEPRIRVRGDKDGNFGLFVTVSHALSEAGLTKIEIEVETRS